MCSAGQLRAGPLLLDRLRQHLRSRRTVLTSYLLPSLIEILLVAARCGLFFATHVVGSVSAARLKADVVPHVGAAAVRDALGADAIGAVDTFREVSFL